MDENPFDLSLRVEGDRIMPVGYIAVMKVLNEDGDMEVQVVAHEVSNYELVGMLTAVLDGQRASNVALEVAPEE